MFLGKSMRIHPLISGFKSSLISFSMSWAVFAPPPPFLPFLSSAGSPDPTSYSSISFSFYMISLSWVSFSSWVFGWSVKVSFNFWQKSWARRLSSVTRERMSTSFPGRDSLAPRVCVICSNKAVAISLYTVVSRPAKGSGFSSAGFLPLALGSATSSF